MITVKCDRCEATVGSIDVYQRPIRGAFEEDRSRFQFEAVNCQKHLANGEIEKAHLCQVCIGFIALGRRGL